MLELSKLTAERLANPRASGDEGVEPSCQEHCAAQVRCGSWSGAGHRFKAGRAGHADGKGRLGRRLGEVREESLAIDTVAMAVQVHHRGTRVPASGQFSGRSP